MSECFTSNTLFLKYAKVGDMMATVSHGRTYLARVIEVWHDHIVMRHYPRGSGCFAIDPDTGDETSTPDWHDVPSRWSFANPDDFHAQLRDDLMRDINSIRPNPWGLLTIQELSDLRDLMKRRKEDS